MADDLAHRDQISRERQEHPGDASRNVGDERQQCRHEQECGRIDQRIVAVEWMADRGRLHRLVNRSVIGGFRMAVEDLAAGGPEVDEVGRERLAVRADEPTALNNMPPDRPRSRHTAQKQVSSTGRVR